MEYKLTRSDLMADLRTAYLDARRHKRNTPYQLRFEANADDNLQRLCDELLDRSYTPEPSSCFIINEPKCREVFAAQFRDRIVHHLYFNYAHEMLERTFIVDTYSCIRRRGTHYGIKRLEKHIRCESQNYTEPCYVLKMDIKGYFMHIDRQKLLDITLRQINKMSRHLIHKELPVRWCDRIDIDFVSYLSKLIIMLNPIIGCNRRGRKSDWDKLPHSKSLFYSPKGCGLPIGNLTSQLFSNVYLNELDHYVKRVLKAKHYGRYVDDFFIVSANLAWLRSQIKQIEKYLELQLGLCTNKGKTIICNVLHGVAFLGAYLRPHRRYVSSNSLNRMRAKVHDLSKIKNGEQLRSRLNSYLGILSHYSSYKIRRELYFSLPNACCYGYFMQGMKRYVLN